MIHEENMKKFTLEYYENKEKEKKAKLREYMLKTKYNMTIEDYNKIHTSQNGTCALCKNPNKSGRHLSVDNSNKRLLCSSCHLGKRNVKTL